MSCNQNADCSQDNPCGKKYTTDDITYSGPPLTCTNIQPCDTLTTVLEKFTNYVCSQAFTTVIINNIVNNIEVLEQFTQLVNQVVDCEVVNNCILNPEPPTSFTFTFSNAHQYYVNACFDEEIAFTLYSNSEYLNPFNTILYTDAELTIPFDGQGFIYRLIPNSLNYVINENGQIQMAATCGNDLQPSMQQTFLYNVSQYPCDCSSELSLTTIINSQQLEENKWYVFSGTKIRVENLVSLGIGTPVASLSPNDGANNCNDLTC